MKDGKMDLHLEIQRQEDVIRELSVDVQLLKEKISGLQGISVYGYIDMFYNVFGGCKISRMRKL